MFNSTPIFNAPHMCDRVRRSFMEFFTLNPRFRFYKEIPWDKYIETSEGLYAHPLFWEKFKEQLKEGE